MQLKNIKIYIFKNKKCNQIHTNYPWIFKSNQKGQPLLTNAQNTAQIYFKQTIIIINYQQIRSFLWNVSAGVISLHISNDCQNAELFQFKLQEQEIRIVQWDQAADSLKKQIQLNCGSEITTKQITQKSKLEKVGNKIGSLFGSLSRKFKRQFISQTVPNSQIVEQIKQSTTLQEKQSEDQKIKWKAMKQQAKNLNNKLNQKIEPAPEAVAKTATKLGQKFNNSDNKIIKEFGLEMKYSLNEGFRSSHIKEVDLQLNPQKPIQSERVLNLQKC